MSITDKIRDIWSKTDNDELKASLATFFDVHNYVSETTACKFVMSKFSTVGKLNEEETRFLSVVNKINLLRTIKLDKLINIFETNASIYNTYPSLRYDIAMLEQIYKNELGYKEIYNVINVLENFRIVDDINLYYKDLKQIAEKYKEDILLLNVLNESASMYGGLYSNVFNSIESYIYEDISRATLMSNIQKHNHEPYFVALYSELEKMSENYTIMNSNKDFSVNNVYSFVYVNEKSNTVYFMNSGKEYTLLRDKNTITESTEPHLPTVIQTINDYIENPNVIITNENITIYLGENKISFSTDGDDINVNGTIVKNGDVLSTYILESGMAYSVYKTDVDNIINIYNYRPLLTKLDFAKEIKNNITNESAVIFNRNNVYHVTIKKDAGNTYVSDINIFKAKNLLKESLNYDINDSVEHFIENAKLSELIEKRDILSNEIEILQSKYYEISTVDIENVDEIRNVITEKRSELIKELKKVQNEITELTVISEDEKKTVEFVVGDLVRIKETGTTGKIVNMDSDNCTILTDENDTMSVSLKQIVSIKQELQKNINDVEKAGKQADAEMQAHNVGESSNKGYGVKGKFEAKDDSKDDSKNPINPDSTFNTEDKKILADISSKLNSNIESLDDLDIKMTQYDKINKKALSDIIAKLKSFKEAIDNELTTL